MTRTLLSALKALALTGPILALTHAQAFSAETCPAFSAGQFLSAHSHSRVIEHVNNRLSGNWSVLINRMNRQLDTLKNRHASRKSVSIRNGGNQRILQGASLARYIQASRARLDIVRCLADQQNFVRLTGFEAAAGGEVMSIEVPRLPAASRNINDINISVETSCREGDTVFRVRNVGADWPRMGRFGIHRIGAGTNPLITSRSMRLKHNQVATFKVRKTAGSRLGLAVIPSWYNRPFSFDANTACS